MTKNEAARQVNEAFKAAGVVKKIHDPKSKGFQVEIDGHVASYEFQHGTNALEQRKVEVAGFRLHLVEELCSRGAPSLVKVEAKAEEPVEGTPKAQA